MPNKTERTIRIYNRLRRGPVTIEILSKWAKQAGIEVSQRQLYRDIESLVTLNISEGENVVEYIDEKNRKTWKLEYKVQDEKLSHYDINSFFLFKNFVPYSVQEKRKDSIEKFETILYKQLSNNHYHRFIEANELCLRKTNFYDNFYDTTEHQQIEILIWALQNKRKIVIENILVNPSNARLNNLKLPVVLMPIELLFHRGRMHIAGVEQNTVDIMIFTVDKNLKFDLTNEIFNRNKIVKRYKEQIEMRFGISESIGNKVHNIKIEFTKDYAESMMNFFWHSSQTWKRMINGNYMLNLQCGIGRELIGWLVQGLDKVKIHQPKMLKNIIIKKLDQTLLIYQHNLMISEVDANADY